MITLQDKNKPGRQGALDKGSTSLDVWEKRVAQAIMRLGDRSLLNRSPLAKLTYIERLAEDKYKGHILPRGIALHDVLLNCAQRISKELSAEPGLARTCNYLDLYIKGLSCKEISEQLGLSREHVSRVYRKKAVELVTEEFLSTIKNG